MLEYFEEGWERYLFHESFEHLENVVNILSFIIISYWFLELTIYQNMIWNCAMPGEQDWNRVSEIL